jgi:hypothetical protein
MWLLWAQAQRGRSSWKQREEDVVTRESNEEVDNARKDLTDVIKVEAAEDML